MTTEDDLLEIAIKAMICADRWEDYVSHRSANPVAAAVDLEYCKAGLRELRDILCKSDIELHSDRPEPGA